jgi:integrase
LPLQRKRRQGTLYLSPDGSHYVVRVTLADGSKSAPIHLASGLSEIAAEKVARLIAEKARKGELVKADATSANFNGSTVRDLAEKWSKLIRASRLSPATIQAHVAHATGPICEAFGDKRPADIRTPDLRAWLRGLRERLSASRTRNVFFSLSKMLDDAAAEEWITLPVNPCRHAKVREEVPAIEARDDEQKARHTEEQARQLIAATSAPERHLRYILAFTTLMRDGELAGLRWADLDTEHDVPVVRVRTAIAMYGTDGHATRKAPKTPASKRTLPLHPLALEALKSWRAKGWEAYVGHAPKDDDPVLPSPEGGTHRPRSSELLRADLEAAGLSPMFNGEPFEFRSTRRSGATWLEAKGISGDTIDRLLGHSPQSTRGRHYSGADLSTWADAIGRINLGQISDMASFEPKPNSSTITRSHLRGLNSRPTVYEVVEIAETRQKQGVLECEGPLEAPQKHGVSDPSVRNLSERFGPLEGVAEGLDRLLAESRIFDCLDRFEADA